MADWCEVREMSVSVFCQHCAMYFTTGNTYPLEAVKQGLVGDHFIQQDKVNGAIVRVKAEVVWLTDNVLHPLYNTQADHSKSDALLECVQLCQQLHVPLGAAADAVHLLLCLHGAISSLLMLFLPPFLTLYLSHTELA